METDPTRMCQLLVGLPDVVVVGVGEWPRWLQVAITARAPSSTCPGCGLGGHDHGRRQVVLVDLAVFGRPCRLVWNKQRWRCPNRTPHSRRTSSAASVSQVMSRNLPRSRSGMLLGTLLRNTSEQSTDLGLPIAPVPPQRAD